jgi:hypothetical protein
MVGNAMEEKDDSEYITISFEEDIPDTNASTYEQYTSSDLANSNPVETKQSQSEEVKAFSDRDDSEQTNQDTLRTYANIEYMIASNDILELINNASAFKNVVYMIEREISMYNIFATDSLNQFNDGNELTNKQLGNTPIHIDRRGAMLDLHNFDYIDFPAYVGVFSSPSVTMSDRQEFYTLHSIKYHFPTRTLIVSINYYHSHTSQYIYTNDEYILINPLFLGKDEVDGSSIFLRVDHISKITFIGSAPPYPHVLLEVQINNCNYYLQTENYRLRKIDCN